MDATESRAWLALVGAIELLPAALDAHLQADSGQTHFEFMVLSLLKNAPHNVLRLTELAAVANATLPRLSKVVSRLQSRGLVERTPCESDRRAINVHLTTAGRKALVLAIPGHIAHVRQLVIDDLTPDQLTALASALEPIIAKLDPHQRLGTGTCTG